MRYGYDEGYEKRTNLEKQERLIKKDINEIIEKYLKQLDDKQHRMISILENIKQEIEEMSWTKN